MMDLASPPAIIVQDARPPCPVEVVTTCTDFGCYDTVNTYCPFVVVIKESVDKPKR